MSEKDDSVSAPSRVRVDVPLEAVGIAADGSVKPAGVIVAEELPPLYRWRCRLPERDEVEFTAGSVSEAQKIYLAYCKLGSTTESMECTLLGPAVSGHEPVTVMPVEK